MTGRCSVCNTTGWYLNYCAWGRNLYPNHSGPSSLFQTDEHGLGVLILILLLHTWPAPAGGLCGNSTTSYAKSKDAVLSGPNWKPSTSIKITNDFCNSRRPLLSPTASWKWAWLFAGIMKKKKKAFTLVIQGLNSPQQRALKVHSRSTSTGHHEVGHGQTSKHKTLKAGKLCFKLHSGKCKGFSS